MLRMKTAALVAFLIGALFLFNPFNNYNNVGVNAQNCLTTQNEEIPLCHENVRDVYFLLDISNSMSQTKLDSIARDYLKKAFCLFYSFDSTNATNNPQIGLGTFNGKATFNDINLQTFTTVEDWVTAVDNLYNSGRIQVFGNTPTTEALRLSRTVLVQRARARLQHVIIITDGEPNPLSGITRSTYTIVSPALNPITHAERVFDAYDIQTSNSRSIKSVCEQLITPFPNFYTAYTSAYPGCRPTNMNDYLFVELPRAANLLKNNGVRISVINLPAKSGAFSGQALLKGQPFDLVGTSRSCVGTSGYTDGVSHCRYVVEGFCVCSNTVSPIVSLPVEENVINAQFDVDQLIEATKTILCPDTDAPTPAIVTKQPTTLRPTTLSPTTAEPTTAEPTTSSPTTAEPTTSSPTTAAPTTSSPTTAAPTTKTPTTAAPTTKTPTTAQPTYPSCGVCSDETAWALQLPKPVGTYSSLPWYDFTTGWGSYVRITEGQTITGTLYAGRTKIAGTFTFKWENGKIGVTWNLCGDWALTSTWHFYYGVSVPGSAPGSYPYQNTVDNAQSQPWIWFNEPVGCGTTLYLALHLEVDCDYVTPNPTTAAPSTGKPTTAAPTTGKPTTVAPSTGKPTTAAPTTGKPTTAAPTTGKPTTVAPSTGKPTTAAPTTGKPTTVAPSTGKPTTSEPTAAIITKNPTTKAPTSNCGVCSDETAWALQLPKPVGTSSSLPWYDFTTGWGSYVKITEGQTITGTLYAGRTKIAGTYSFKWVNGKIGVTWSLCEDWALTNTWHFYYGTNVPGSAPGSYPYQRTDGGLKSQPWIWFNEPAGCGSFLYLALHVEVDCDLLTDAPTTSTPTAAVVTNKPTTSSSKCVEVWMDFIQNSGPLSNYPDGEQVWDSSPSSVTLTGKLRAPGGLSPLAPNEPFGTSTVTIQSDRSKATFYFDVGVGRRIKTAKVYFGLYPLLSNSWVGTVWTPNSQTVTIPSGCTKFFKGCDIKRFAAAVLCVENVSS